MYKKKKQKKIKMEYVKDVIHAKKKNKWKNILIFK